MWTPRCQWPVSASRVSEMASSKSRAVAGVDRDDRVVGQILAAGEVGLVERLGRLAGLVEHVRGERVGQVKGADDREGVHAGRAAGAEHLGDDAFAPLVERREPEHLDDDLVVRRRPLRAGVADVDAVREHPTVDADERLAVALVIGADELTGGPLQDADHLPLRRHLATTGPGDLDQHFVAGGGVERVLERDAHLGGRLAGRDGDADEPAAGRQSAEHPGNGVGSAAATGADGVVLAELDLAGLDEVAEGLAEERVVGVADTELAGQRLRLDRDVVLAGEGREDLLFHE